MKQFNFNDDEMHCLIIGLKQAYASKAHLLSLGSFSSFYSFSKIMDELDFIDDLCKKLESSYGLDERMKVFDNAAKSTNYLVFKDSLDGEFVAGFATEQAAYDYIDYLSTVSSDDYIVSF